MVVQTGSTLVMMIHTTPEALTHPLYIVQPAVSLTEVFVHRRAQFQWRVPTVAFCTYHHVQIHPLTVQLRIWTLWRALI